MPVFATILNKKSINSETLTNLVKFCNKLKTDLFLLDKAFRGG